MQSPHDRFFRLVFSRPEHAAGELQMVLPAGLSARIDWASLQLIPGTFIDPQLSELRTDLLFSATMDSRDIRLYLLLEHQSTVDPRMPFRLLEYMVRIWAAYERSNPSAQRLPAILPCVVYANDAAWVAPVAFVDLLDIGPEALEHFRPYLPSFTFLLDELTPKRDEDLRQRAMTALGQLALHFLRLARPKADLTQDLQAWTQALLAVLESPNGVEALGAVLRYVLEVSETPLENVHQFARSLGPRAEEAFMTGEQILLERGRAEGEAKGRAEGEAKGRAALLLRLLEKKFGPIPANVNVLVEDAPIEQLDRWAEGLLSANSLPELFSA